MKSTPRTIVALSGGLASAWCADWAFKNCENVVLYFNDTGWEDADLYRFLDELASHFGAKIHRDNDGRNPEQLFNDEGALACNRMPFCSRILKAERLQRFFNDGDRIVFGIGNDERHRAERLVGVYQAVAAKRQAMPILVFPIIQQGMTRRGIEDWIAGTGIAAPRLYGLGFAHNNCGGGCVRMGKRQWAHLLRTLPAVYKERERVENEFRDRTGKDVHFLKDETLTSLRLRIEAAAELPFFDDDDNTATECIGICGAMQ